MLYVHPNTLTFLILGVSPYVFLMRKYAAPRTMLGAIICHAQKANAAGAGAKGEVLSSIFAIVSPLRLAHLTCKHANNLVSGRLI